MFNTAKKFQSTREYSILNEEEKKRLESYLAEWKPKARSYIKSGSIVGGITIGVLIASGIVFSMVGYDEYMKNYGWLALCIFGAVLLIPPFIRFYPRKPSARDLLEERALVRYLEEMQKTNNKSA